MSTLPANKKVVGLGLACLDQLILWQDMSAPVQSNKIVAHDVQGGGMVGTALVAVTRLGGQAEYWGAVGDDWMGEMILQGLRHERVDTGQVVKVPGKEGPLVVVCIDQPTGERHFQYWTGFEDPAEPIGSLDRLHDAGCLLIDGCQRASALRAAQEARRLGVPVVGDVGWIHEHTKGLLACMDYAIASENCARSLGSADDIRKACQLLHAMGPGQVVVTLGSRGLVAYDGQRFLEQPAFPVEVVDTTGAGDTFHGAFCFGLVQGFTLEKNLAFASATAALKCRKMGGRKGIPAREEVEAMVNWSIG